MSRYVSVPCRAPHASDWMDDTPLILSLTVPETQPVDTGLVDVHGNRIVRVAPPIGFGRNEEW